MSGRAAVSFAEEESNLAEIWSAHMWDATFEDLLRKQLPFLPADTALDADAELRDLGLDSMGSVELLTLLEDAYDVRFVDDMLSLVTFRTPAVLWAALGTLTGQPA